MSTTDSSDYEDDGYWSTSDDEPVKKNAVVTCASKNEQQQLSLSCAIYEEEEDEEESDSDKGSSSDSDLEELFLSSPLPAPIATTPTTSKVVHFSTLKQPVGDSLLSSTKSGDLKLLATMSTAELDDLYAKQEAEKQPKGLPLASKRDIPMGELLAPSTTTTTTTTTTTQQIQDDDDDFTIIPLSSMSASELAALEEKHEDRQSAIFSVKKPAVVAATSGRTYSLNHVDTLSAKKREELFMETRKKLLTNLTADRRSTSLACPIDLNKPEIDVDALSMQELRELVRECRAKHRSSSSAIVTTATPLGASASESLIHTMGTDTRVGKPMHTKLSDPHGTLAYGSVLGVADQVIDTLVGGGGSVYDPYYYDDRGYYYYPPYYGGYGYPSRRRRHRQYYYGKELAKKQSEGGDIVLKATNTSTLVHSSTLSASQLAIIRENSAKPLKSPLVHSSTLSASQLATVRENSAKPLNSPLVHASTLSAKQLATVKEKSGSPLVHASTLSAKQLATVRENSAVVTTTTTDKLTNVNSLPLTQQKAIREAITLAATQKEDKSVAVKTFSNQKSTLNAKKEYELKSSRSVMTNTTVNSLFHGLACPMHVDEVAFVDHLRIAHPAYDELLRKNVSRRVLDALFNSKDRNFIIIVPGKSLLALYKQQGKSLEMAKMAAAYLTVLLLAEEQIPADNRPYSCANLLRENRITVRRIDDETIEVDNSILAKLDRASGGHLYKMLEPVIEDLDEEEEEEIIEDIVDEVLSRVEERQQEEEEVVEEEEEEAAEEIEELIEEAPVVAKPASSSSNTTIIINTGSAPTPKVIATLPAADSSALAIVPVEEQVVASAGTRGIFLAGVYRNTFYKNKKIETFASKMVSGQYSGAKDMANYIASVDGQQQQQQVNQLLIKTFAYETLFEKCRATATQMTTAERLTPECSFVIKEEKANTLSYALDASLKMKEFLVDTKSVKISKHQLINHFNVLCFETKKSGQYASLCFSLPDETKSPTDTYMSADENMLLKFKDNLLQSVAINTNAANFAISPMTMDVGVLSSDVLQNISVQVPMAEHASVLYAKELSFEQFAQALIPLSQPSFVKRVKVAYSEAIGAPTLRLQRVTGAGEEAFKREVASYAEGSERTVEMTMAIARGASETAKKLRGFTFHRMLMRSNVNANQFLIRYDYDEALNQGKEHPSFNAMINTAKVSEQPTLSIELLHPLKKKRALFRFQLASARSPPQDKESVYTALSSDGLHFDFVLSDNGAKIEKIYVRFFHHTAPSFEKDITKFLAHEAYAYQRLKVNIGTSYMSTRMEKYFTNSTLPKEKLDLKKHREFFSTLNKEIERYMETEGLTPLLVGAKPSKMTDEDANALRDNNYIVLQAEELSHFHSLIVSGFSLGAPITTTTTTTPSKVLEAVVREYKTSLASTRDTKDVAFALYMDRFKIIAHNMATSRSMVSKK